MRRPSPYELPSYAVEEKNQHYGISHRFNSFDQAWKSVRIIGTWGLFRDHKFLREKLVTRTKISKFLWHLGSQSTRTFLKQIKCKGKQTKTSWSAIGRTNFPAPITLFWEPIMRRKMSYGGISQRPINPLTPRSDSHVTSPCNIHTLSSRQVMRILKLREVEFVFLIYHQNLVTNLQGNE